MKLTITVFEVNSASSNDVSLTFLWFYLTQTENVVLTPASEAYCEPVFSECGELSAGKRSRLCVSMEQGVFMKLNRQLYCPN